MLHGLTPVVLIILISLIFCIIGAFLSQKERRYKFDIQKNQMLSPIKSGLILCSCICATTLALLTTFFIHQETNIAIIVLNVIALVLNSLIFIQCFRAFMNQKSIKVNKQQICVLSEIGSVTAYWNKLTDVEIRIKSLFNKIFMKQYLPYINFSDHTGNYEIILKFKDLSSISLRSNLLGFPGLWDYIHRLAKEQNIKIKIGR